VSGGDLAGLRVVAFESRRAAEMASLLARHGAVPMVAPSMREIPHADNAPARTFAVSLREGAFDVVVLMTGVGTRALIAAVEPDLAVAELAAALSRLTVIARGPKPAAVLREIGVGSFLVAPEPNTWRDVLALFDRLPPTLRVGIQEHGAPSEGLYRGLEARGHEVRALSVYRWALPEETAPLRAALHALARGEARVALFTSQNQLASVLAVAEEERLVERLRAALRGGVVASIGPVCTEALAAEGLPPDIEPEHPKMGHLVKAVAERAAAILAQKAG
jgi:uroporphyrinogen-III synthase